MAEKRKNWFVRHKVLTIIGIIILFAIGVGAASSDTNNTPTKSTDSTSSSTENKTTEAKEVKKQEPDVPAEYKSALSQADLYANNMHMSKQGVYDQLVSEYGGQFSAAAAKYAIDHVRADWKANALAKAKDYQDKQHLSPAAIHDQLTSEYGEKFTQAEADYAIEHLND